MCVCVFADTDLLIAGIGLLTEGDGDVLSLDHGKDTVTTTNYLAVKRLADNAGGLGAIS